MDSKKTFTGETSEVSQQGTLAIEMFLNENYRFRRNMLNGKVEFATLPEAAKTAEGLSNGFDEANLEFRALTPEAQNSIVIRAKREEILEKGSPKTEISEWVGSEEVPEYNPIQDYLNSLPKWDGQNHIARLFGRIPGVSSEQLNYLTIWLQFRAVELSHHLAPLRRSPLASDGHAARQRMCANADWSAGLWKDRLRASPLAVPSARVLPRTPEPLEQVRQGDGADAQPLRQPR